MTRDNRKANIADELQRGDDAVKAAHALAGLGLHADAVSRAYHAVLHALKALLLSRGLEAKSHAGSIHLFNREFVRTGLLDSSNNRLLSGMQRSRELADYAAGIVFSEEDTASELQQAERFISCAKALLAKESWLS